MQITLYIAKRKQSGLHRHWQRCGFTGSWRIITASPFPLTICVRAACTGYIEGGRHERVNALIASFLKKNRIKSILPKKRRRAHTMMDVPGGFHCLIFIRFSQLAAVRAGHSDAFHCRCHIVAVKFFAAELVVACLFRLIKHLVRL